MPVAVPARKTRWPRILSRTKSSSVNSKRGGSVAAHAKVVLFNISVKGKTNKCVLVPMPSSYISAQLAVRKHLPLSSLHKSCIEMYTELTPSNNFLIHNEETWAQAKQSPNLFQINVSIASLPSPSPSNPEPQKPFTIRMTLLHSHGLSTHTRLITSSRDLVSPTLFRGLDAYLPVGYPDSAPRMAICNGRRVMSSESFEEVGLGEGGDVVVVVSS
ncbi:hypothetical protein DL96DRAFT_1711062 [Flagelloscypha sp. PMI_526]|nr:hypothetical protein DL96DRAFT_1711062 [Flagelloscypha sp. PMI_526]